MAAEQYAQGEIKGPQLAEITEIVEDKLRKVEGALSAGRPGHPLEQPSPAEDDAAMWDFAPLEVHRVFVDALMTVTILPTAGRHGRKSDEATVPFVPKFPH